LTRDPAGTQGSGFVEVATAAVGVDLDPDVNVRWGKDRTANTFMGQEVNIGGVMQHVKVGVAGAGVPAGGAVRVVYVDGT
jgi:hypothetical protein